MFGDDSEYDYEESSEGDNEYAEDIAEEFAQEQERKRRAEVDMQRRYAEAIAAEIVEDILRGTEQSIARLLRFQK